MNTDLEQMALALVELLSVWQQASYISVIQTVDVDGKPCLAMAIVPLPYTSAMRVSAGEENPQTFVSKIFG